MRSKKIFIAVVLGAFLAGVVFTGGILFASGNNWIGKVVGSQKPESTSEYNSTSLPGRSSSIWWLVFSG